MGTVEERIVIDFGQAVGALRTVAAESTKTAAAVGSVGTSSKAASAGAINLGNQLADVAAQMSTGANPFTIAVQQGPQAAAALAQMGSAGVAAGAALAALSAVVVAGGAAWRIYGADARIAEQVATNLAAAHAELKPLLDSTRWAMIDLAEKTGQISPLMADLERNSLRALTAWGNATDETRAKLAALKREQSSVTTQIIDAGQAFYDMIDPTGLLSEGYQRLWGGSRELQIEIDAQTAAVDQSIVSLRENRKVTEDAIIADEAAKRAKEAHTATVKSHAEALRLEVQQQRFLADLAGMAAASWTEDGRAADALGAKIRDITERAQELKLPFSEAADAIARLTKEMQANASVRFAEEFGKYRYAPTPTSAVPGTFGGYMDAYGPRPTARDAEMTAFANAQADLTLAFSRGAIGAETYAEKMKEVTAAHDAAVASQSAAAAGQGISTVMGGANSIMGSLASMGGPIGWIAMIAQLVKSIGDGLLDGIHEWAMSLMDTVGRLPTILTDAVVRSIQEGIPALFNMIPDFLEALGQAIPQLVEVLMTELATSIPRIVELLTQTLPAAFANMLRALFDWETWYNVGVQIVKGFASAMAGTNPTAKKGHGWWNPFGGLMNIGEMIAGSHDTGAYSIGRPGLYMLHGGERVLTSGQATSARNRGQGGGVTIQIGSVMGGRAGVRELVDLIRRESGPMGSRVSLGV